MIREHIMDFTVVTCDGQRALVDFDVYDKVTGAPVSLRVSYALGDSVLTPELGEQYDLLEELARSPEALADVREAVLYQRDENRSKN